MILQSWLVLVISAENILGYCSLTKQEYTAKVKFIREGFEKRVRRYTVSEDWRDLMFVFHSYTERSLQATWRSRVRSVPAGLAWS